MHTFARVNLDHLRVEVLRNEVNLGVAVVGKDVDGVVDARALRVQIQRKVLCGREGRIKRGVKWKGDVSEQN